MTYEAWRISYQSSEQAARAAYAECARLQAKIEAMERQEPVGKFIRHPSNGLWEQDGYGDNPDARPLYALPGAQNVPNGWLRHAARMAALARKLREPDWHFESIREMQRELCALEDAALAAAASEAKP